MLVPAMNSRLSTLPPCGPGGTVLTLPSAAGHTPAVPKCSRSGTAMFLSAGIRAAASTGVTMPG